MTSHTRSTAQRPCRRSALGGDLERELEAVLILAPYLEAEILAFGRVARQ
jgi:hypothetical protein